jgi:hypothetical protein
MTLPRVSLAAQSLDDIHERAILLWIQAKQANPEENPAHGIYFVLTNKSWPYGLPEPNDAIELCSILSQTFGDPPLSEDARNRLNVKAFALFHEYTRGRGPVRIFAYLKWANRVGYALALLSLSLSGFSWWVVGLGFAVWSCFGAARTATRMRDDGPRPSWEVPAISLMHFIALVALYTASVVKLLSVR